MRNQLLILSVALLSACATTGGGNSTAPFQGDEEVKKRQKELNDKAAVVTDCLRVKAGDADLKGGIFEVTANADGSLVIHTMKWDGSPTMQACIIDATKKARVSPLAGPSVSVLWPFLPKDAKPLPPPPDPDKLPGSLPTVNQEINALIDACAQRNLPPEFPADIDVSFFIFPGGKVAAPTVTHSTAKDGNFDTCAQQAVGSRQFPDLSYDGPYPISLHFHVGKLDKL